ncbi:hypothetical protein LOTGIDRAFT_235090 [Lottia gigantea]|uniref:Ubiquitin-like domain-containing protein n=1 Tax=Lottia gigantea TaxID=225164 RepID=V3ZXT2_LOTGI|nr:hypothetical protein LOTGIDRAFT_235090 [Lottia gigantea]ESO87415.1 hypothetical protein LOTGIDRAFT_235090 [Lottia gigantea]
MASSSETADYVESNKEDIKIDSVECVTNESEDNSTPGTQENDPGGCLTDTGKIVVQETDKSNAEKVDFKIIYNKSKYDVSFSLDETIHQLKQHVQGLTGVPHAMQKLMYRGLAKDECTLRQLNVTKGAKIMVVGSTLNDVLSVSAPSKQELAEAAKAEASSKEPLSEMKQHKKVLEKYGKPEDANPGVKNRKDPLPHVPLSGMYNKSGGKVRLTFKLESDQLWIGTKERTDKIPMNSIKAVVSEPIKGHEEYHLMGIQLGPTEASRLWIYWVPAQYVDSVKDAILGKWQFF